MARKLAPVRRTADPQLSADTISLRLDFLRAKRLPAQDGDDGDLAPTTTAGPGNATEIPSPSPGTDPGAHQARLKSMLAFEPKINAVAVAAVREQVVAACIRIAYKCRRYDQQALTPTYRFAVWCWQEQGSFDWQHDLTPERIDLYVKQCLGHMEESSRGTLRSTLLRASRGGNLTWTTKKRPAGQGYTPQQWGSLWQAAENAGDYTLDACALLALTGEAGLLPPEASRAEGSWVQTEGNRTIIRVPSTTGEFREVPIFGKGALILRQAAQLRPGYLLSPHVASTRYNVISHLKIQLKGQHKQFGRFDARRARHYWLTGLLTSPVPFNIVCAIAGIHRGTATPVDLISHLPAPTLDDTYRGLTRTRSH